VAALAKTWILSVLRKASNTSNTGAWPFPEGQRSQNFKKESQQVANTSSTFQGVLEEMNWSNAWVFGLDFWLGWAAVLLSL
jgi:hypothetical protein